MSDPLITHNGSVGIRDGRIVTVQSGATPAPPWTLSDDTIILDASGKLVTPGLIDCHTHTVFCGSREDEFTMKIQGKPYMEIARSGGGIRKTVRETRAATYETLRDLAEKRLIEALRLGITTVEIKSGYGLSLEAELKILEVVAELQDRLPLRLIPTLLAAHEVPEDLPKAEYLRLVTDSIIPAVAARKLAIFCDVFCEKGVYSIDETRLVLEAARRNGLKPKIHAEQLSTLGGAVLAGDLSAISADHLDHIDDRGIQALAAKGVVPVLLPGCNFFMGLKQYPPARMMMDAGLPVALSTDFNPGSCMTQNLALIMTIACTQLRMTPQEAFSAVTINAAAALGLEQEIGMIAPGYWADLVIWRVPTIDYVPYHFGQNHVETVIVKGHPVTL